MKHLLVASDLSPIADAALERAIAFARRDSAKITIAYAEPDYTVTPAMGEPESAAILEWANLSESQRDATDAALGARAAKVKAAGVPVAVVAKKGNPDDLIPDIAGEVGADLVVIATHGRTGIRRFLLGS